MVFPRLIELTCKEVTSVADPQAWLNLTFFPSLTSLAFIPSSVGDKFLDQGILQTVTSFVTDYITFSICRGSIPPTCSVLIHCRVDSLPSTILPVAATIRLRQSAQIPLTSADRNTVQRLVNFIDNFRPSAIFLPTSLDSSRTSSSPPATPSPIGKLLSNLRTAKYELVYEDVDEGEGGSLISQSLKGMAEQRRQSVGAASIAVAKAQK
jgi:hypothetical protein